jgi:hypothetical protein
MKVARHEMPGKRPGMIRPVGNGMIRGARSCLSCKTLKRPWQPDHTVPYGTGPVSTQIPGSKLPGYDHGVPTGQKSDTSEKCMGIFR